MTDRTLKLIAACVAAKGGSPELMLYRFDDGSCRASIGKLSISIVLGEAVVELKAEAQGNGKDETDALETLLRNLGGAPVLDWQPVSTAPKTGFFLVWSPRFPDMTTTFRGEIFHEARKPGTPLHLSAAHYTLWSPCPLPSQAEIDLGAAARWPVS